MASIRPMHHTNQVKQSLSWFGALGSKPQFFLAVLTQRIEHTSPSAPHEEIGLKLKCMSLS